MRRYYIKTYGCQMNIADSERLAGVLESAGYQQARAENEADIILVNTCVVRQNAEDRAAGYISSIKSLKQNKPHLKIGVCGCLVTTPGKDVKQIFPHVDIFIAPNQPERLVEFLKLTPLTPFSPSPLLRGKGRGDGGVTKYITIMHGCDNFCSYCIVPYVRGREQSRPIEEILSEIKQIDFKQYKEIFLLGQNVNSYKYGLANLLQEIESLIPHTAHPIPHTSYPTPKRIRFMTSHPKDMSDEIISAVAELPHVCEYFHLPVQHGDDEMLKQMNRGYTVDYYKKLVDKIRGKIPGAAITSDVIVGYPGETDQQFQHTLYIIERIGFDACNTAAYSVRTGTAAAKLKDDLPQKVKQERLQQAMAVVEKVAQKQNEKLVGSTQEVLVDNRIPLALWERGKRGGEGFSGRTRTNKIVKFEREPIISLSGQTKKGDLLGRLVNVKITSAKSWLLKGELVNGKF